MIIWLVGLSSSGKTTIGKKIFKFWKSQDKATVFIDGDEIRKKSFQTKIMIIIISMAEKKMQRESETYVFFG